MPITEASRHHMISQLELAIGRKATMTLAEHLPPIGWADVATKTDIDNLRTATKTDIDNLRTATKTDIDNLRTATKTDIDNLRTATKTDIDNLRADIDNLRTATKADIDNLRTATKADLEVVENRMLAALHEALHKQTLWVIGGVAGITTFILGLFKFIFG